jgi:hypothetical protein
MGGDRQNWLIWAKSLSKIRRRAMRETVSTSARIVQILIDEHQAHPSPQAANPYVRATDEVGVNAAGRY